MGKLSGSTSVWRHSYDASLMLHPPSGMTGFTLQSFGIIRRGILLSIGRHSLCSTASLHDSWVSIPPLLARFLIWMSGFSRNQ